MKISKIILLSTLPFAIVGCGGGSGGPAGPGGPGGETFTGFSTLKPGTTTVVKGVGREVSVDANGKVSDFSSAGPVQAKLTTDKDGEPLSLTLERSSGAITIDTKSGTIEDEEAFVLAYSNDLKKGIILAGPEGNGFEYQTFGAWAADEGTKASVGAFSIGAETDASKVPTSGTATFTGRAAGIYVDGAGNPDAVVARATLNADFANKTIDFRTSGTESATEAARSDLDLNGKLTYSSGAIAGDVATAGGLKGNVEGRFYGPAAEEVGGTFALSGNSGERFGGGFGASRK